MSGNEYPVNPALNKLAAHRRDEAVSILEGACPGLPKAFVGIHHEKETASHQRRKMLIEIQLDEILFDLPRCGPVMAVRAKEFTESFAITFAIKPVVDRPGSAQV